MLSKLKKVGLGVAALSGAAVGGAAVAGAATSHSGAAAPNAPAGKPPPALRNMPGPNLAVTGSLSAVLWLQAARAVEARPSIATYTRFGVVLVPLTLVATVALSSRI